MIRHILAVAVIAVGCASPRPPVQPTPAPDHVILRIKGSDTMGALTRRWAEEFMQDHPGVAVSAEGGGTRAGVEALIEGRTDLCAASRPLTPDESRRLLSERGGAGFGTLSARDALSIYTNFDNPVRNLGLEQVRGLLSGKIGNWKDVGGPDAPVHVYIREPNSGTRAFLQEHVLEGDKYASSARTVSGTWALADAVAHDPVGVGFGGLGAGQQVSHCRIDGIAPTPTNVRSGAYPIARYLYLYTATPAEGLAKEFLDWVLGPRGQEVVEELDYVPLWETEP
jgi:phosphate transport system substrate-binding protein